jgi:hypothetical protein
MKVLVIFFIIAVTLSALTKADENRICYKCDETPPYNNYKDCGRCENGSYDLEKVYRGGWVKCCNLAREITTKKFEGGYSDGDQDAKR